MSDDDFSYDPYGDTDANNVPDDGSGEDASAGDGLPGVPVEGHPGWRAGVFSAGRNLLGLVPTSRLVADSADGAPASLQFGTDQPFAGAGDPRLMLASNPGGLGPGRPSKDDPYPMPPAYMPDGHGGVQLRPDFAATHPKGPFDFGAMAHNIHWGGVAKDLWDIATGVANSKIQDVVGDALDLPSWVDLPELGMKTWKMQNEANKPGAQPAKGADRTTNGLS